MVVERSPKNWHSISPIELRAQTYIMPYIMRPDPVVESSRFGHQIPNMSDRYKWVRPFRPELGEAWPWVSTFEHSPANALLARPRCPATSALGSACARVEYVAAMVAVGSSIVLKQRAAMRTCVCQRQPRLSKAGATTEVVVNHVIASGTIDAALMSCR